MKAIFAILFTLLCVQIATSIKTETVIMVDDVPIYNGEFTSTQCKDLFQTIQEMQDFLRTEQARNERMYAVITLYSEQRLEQIKNNLRKMQIN